MTEAEWLACADPTSMLAFLQGKASERKLRLFACACCKHIWPLMTDDRSRRAVELAELSADHPVAPETLDAVSGEAEEAFEDAITDSDESVKEDSTGLTWSQYAAACSAASYASNPSLRDEDVRVVIEAISDASSDATAQRPWQAVVLRDIFGNPFRPVALDPAWRTSAAVGLAAAIYSDRAFDRFPILADALEDAGCDDPDILAHCRTHPEHARGCWVVDLVLGKN
jgi:hypothetical protein